MPYPLASTQPPTTMRIMEDMILAGQAYSALYTQTIGGAAQGFYSLAVFNPSNSGKSMYLFSAKAMQNFSVTTVTFVMPNSNPNLNTSVTPINMKTIPGVASAMTATADSAAVSYPGSGITELFIQAEVLGTYGYIIMPGNAAQLFCFCANSQQYVLGMKWFEY